MESSTANSGSDQVQSQAAVSSDSGQALAPLVNVTLPTSWQSVAALSMAQLRRLLLHLQVPVTGRVTKVDLQYSLCQKLKISTTGECLTGFASIERATIPPEVLPTVGWEVWLSWELLMPLRGLKTYGKSLLDSAVRSLKSIVFLATISSLMVIA